MQQDIYFNEDYISLYLKKDESIFKFAYGDNEKLFSQIAIKRPIKKISEAIVDDGFFDLETVYGYGGFLSNTTDETFLNRALKEYELHCRDNNIVAEFIRYHPFQHISETITTSLDFFVKDRDTVFIDLSLSKEERWGGYSKKTRNILRRCSEQLTFKESGDISAFLELYYRTMEKNTAEDFYFFKEDYFNQLIALENVKLYEVSYNNTPASIGFFMFGDEIVHYHLSGNNTELSKFNGNYFLLDSVCDEMKNKYDLKYLHLGGGRTNLDDDSLLQFKKKFSESLLPFYIAGKVYNKEIYQRYNNKWLKNNNNVSYFLKYRL